MNIIAHKSKDGREQSLQEHSQNVSRMAVSFAAPFGGEKLAERIGLSHDAGKNTMGFQQYIRNPGKYAKSPHAVIGATLNGIAGDFPSAVIVEGHHSGLHNMCDTRSNLNAALAERGQDVVKAQEYFSTDAISQTAVFPEFARKNRVLGQFSFIKMEFSCLTDADYQDTERFMHGYSPRSYDYDSFSDIYDMFRKHIQPWIDSVIIFDEVQQFPANFLKPCIKCIESLAANFGARVVLSTATQPALESYFNTIKPREIIDDSESYVEPFRRCNIDNIGTIKAETLVKRIQKHKQCLCVVNEKDEAKSIYNAVKNGRCKNLYCLTTDITPYDRERLLRRIRQNLKDNEPCVVISTSLIESGVDVDFPCGYRELSSLDSILQTAGRVNRNGLRDCNSCTLFVFDGPQAEYHALKNGASKSQYDNMGDFGNRKSITKDILQKYDADSPKAIHEYFSRLYGYKGDGLDKFDIVKMANSKLIPFQDISQKFKIIDEDTVTVIISQTAEASELVGKIRNQTATKDDIRKVGKYAVSVRRSKYDKYLAASTEVLTTKVCNDVEEPDICNLVDMGLYTNIGVIFDAAA